jgi:glucuronosyltransferase
LEAFVSSSEAGFVVFAIGSAIKMEDMPEEMIQSFIKAFARLPQRVVWQWKGKVRSDLPANVLAVPWLPQQDLLGII